MKPLLDIFGNVVGQCRQPFAREDWRQAMHDDRRYTDGFRAGRDGLGAADSLAHYTLGHRDGTARRIHAESVRAGRWVGRVGVAQLTTGAVP